MLYSVGQLLDALSVHLLKPVYQTNKQTMLQLRKAFDNFIASTLKFLADNKFDGLDLDWEYPSTADDKAKFALWVQVCLAHVHEPL